MKKTICITPVDDDMELLVTAVKILNQFKVAGFTTRLSFVDLICDLEPKYNDRAGIEKLNTFWASRVKSQELNDDLERIYDGLKTS